MQQTAQRLWLGCYHALAAATQLGLSIPGSNPDSAYPRARARQVHKVHAHVFMTQPDKDISHWIMLSRSPGSREAVKSCAFEIG